MFLVELYAFRYSGCGRFTQTGKGHFQPQITVNRIVDGLTHPNIRQRLLLRVDRHVIEINARIALNGEMAVLFHGGDQV